MILFTYTYFCHIQVSPHGATDPTFPLPPRPLPPRHPWRISSPAISNRKLASLLLQPPRRLNNSGHHDSCHHDEAPRNDGANEPPLPTQALTGLHSDPPSSLPPVDTVSIQGAFSSAPMRFHRAAKVPTTGGVGTPSSAAAAAAAASHEFSRPAMTMFDDLV